MFHKIRFDTKEGKTHVFLDNQEVQGCIRAEFYYDVCCVPVVQLTLKAVNVEVNADTAYICKVSDDQTAKGKRKKAETKA